MITGINKQKTLTKHMLCECKCKCDGRKWNSNQSWNHNKCRYECKKQNTYGEKILFEILLNVLAKMGNVSKYYWRFSDYVWWDYRRVR